MHLLDTKTKQLKTFYGDDIPKYAILSHMWGSEEDEVLFRHIAGSYADKIEGKMRKGYAKIKGACKQAIEEGLAYIWIDTCCIDKSSSAELSEAINSMYKWYQKSSVCYVYLEDVRSGGDGQSENDKDAMFPIVSFERSRWFSRGWTLQELIAPKYVVFFSRGWVDIGTRTSLQHTISAVTRIRVEMLTSYNPEKASVAEKMSWAAYRKTTRVEDVAYCMMGLLGVNMPLLYGEGNKAFRRLQEEFMKGSDDDSLFAWKSHSHLYFYREAVDDSRGMLAASPWEFRDGMDIVRSDDGAYSPYSMTNQGLKIKLPLLPIDLDERNMLGTDSESIFKTILKCTVRSRLPTRRIVIYLRKIREGRYQRIFPHWLDETEMSPNGIKPTSLLVPQTQINTEFTRLSMSRYNEIEILPTKSGFTLDGHSLVKGKKHHYKSNGAEVIIFKNQGKRFGVAVDMVIGSNDDIIPWLDFVNDADEEQLYDLYKEGRSRARLRERYLDRLSEKIPGENWWVTASAQRKYNNRGRYYGFYVVIDIQREPIRAKGWYIPPAILTSGTLFDKFVTYPTEYHYNVHPNFKKMGHNWSVVFNPNVKRVLDVSLVYTLRPESPSNNRRSPSDSTLKPQHSLVHCIQFSHDSKYLATGSDVVRVYDMKTGAKIHTFIDKPDQDKAAIHSICFSPDSNFVATGNSNGSIKLWDINAQCIYKVLNGHGNVVNTLCFSPNGYLIISGSEYSDAVRIWNIADGTSRILTIKSGTGLQSIAISPSGSLLATGGSSGIIQIWDMLTTQLLEEFPKHRDNVHIVFTPDGKGLVSGVTDKPLRYWNVSGLVPTVVEGEYKDLSNSGTSSVLALENVDEKNQHTRTLTTGQKDSVTSIAVSHNGHWIISHSESSNKDRVLFWDLKDASAQFILTIYNSSLKPRLSTLAVSPTGNIFATISDKHMVQVWRYDNIEPQDGPSSHLFLMS